MYETMNLAACYGFVTYEDWGSYSVPLPLTGDLLRRQCRSRSSFSVVATSEALPAGAAGFELIEEQVPDPEREENEEHNEQPQDMPEPTQDAEQFAQVHVELLSPCTQQMVERYPTCFTKKCPDLVWPLDAMQALRQKGDFEGIRRVACAHEAAFLCMYDTMNLAACHGFVTYEDWGSWSVPLPLTGDLLRRQCRSPSSFTVVEASEASPIEAEEHVPEGHEVQAGQLPEHLAEGLPTQPEVILP